MSVVVEEQRRTKARSRSEPDRFAFVVVIELTEAQWVAVAPLLPPSRSTGRRRTTDLRRVVTAIHHHWSTGCPWRSLPGGLPAWSTVYTYYRNWVQDGTARKVREVLNPPKPSELMRRPKVRRAPRRLPVRLDPDRRIMDEQGRPIGARLAIVR